MKLPYRLHFGRDTWYVFHLLKEANSFGIMEKVYHHYAVRKKSGSSFFFESGFDDAETLWKGWAAFLQENDGFTEENKSFLACVYSNDCADIVNTLASSNRAVPYNAKRNGETIDFPKKRKLALLQSLLNKTVTQDILKK